MNRIRYHIPLVLSTFIIISCTTAKPMAQEKPKTNDNIQVVEKINKENTEKYKGNADFLIKPGLIADKKNRKVTVYAEASGVTNDVIEFFLIAPKSGHDYESMAISYAKAEDIMNAMKFIGMQAGTCINYAELRFWPKGERVIIKTKPCNSDKPAVRLEKFVLVDDKPMPELGFIYTGSSYFKKNDISVFASDEKEPNSIISDYNESYTVFDLPLYSPQNSVYNHQRANPEYSYSKETLIELSIEPEFKDGKKRVNNLMLYVASEQKASSDSNAPPEYTTKLMLKNLKNETLNKEEDLKSVLKYFSVLTGNKEDPFVTIKFADNVFLGQILEFCKVINTIDVVSGIRVDPPSEGQLYYKAFIPNPKHLDRTSRIVHPWEMTINKDTNGISAKLIETESIWKEDSAEPTYKTTEYAAANGTELKKAMEDCNKKKIEEGKDPVIPVILITASPYITHGELMTLLKPIMDIPPTVHVYIR